MSHLRKVKKMLGLGYNNRMRQRAGMKYTLGELKINRPAGRIPKKLAEKDEK